MVKSVQIRTDRLGKLVTVVYKKEGPASAVVDEPSVVDAVGPSEVLVVSGIRVPFIPGAEVCRRHHILCGAAMSLGELGK